MKMSKFAAALLVLIMVLSLGVTAWADTATDTNPKVDLPFSLEAYSLPSYLYPGQEFELTLYYNGQINVEGDSDYLSLSDPNFTIVREINKKKDTASRFYLTSSNVSVNDDDGDRGTIKLKIKVGPNAAEGTYQIELAAVCSVEQDGDMVTVAGALSPVNVNVRVHTVNTEPEEPSSSEEATVRPILTPHLVITGFSTAGAELSDDENFGFSVTFMNTSRDVPLQNVMITVSLPEGVSMPFASTNFYIDRIDAADSETLSFTLKGKKNIEEDVLPLGLAFNYQYYFNEAYLDGSDSETVGLSFGGGEQEETEDRFEVSGVTLPDYLYPGEEGYLTIKMVNKGKEQIMNVQAKIESPNLQNTGASEYFGLLDVNKQDEIELPMMALEGGEVIGTVTISYELTDGTEKTVVRDFTAYAEEISEPVYEPGWDDPGMYEPEKPAGPAWWVWALIAVGGVTLLIVVITVLKKRAAKKKQAAIDAEDSEDNE